LNQEKIEVKIGKGVYGQQLWQKRSTTEGNQRSRRAGVLGAKSNNCVTITKLLNLSYS
jgi:hypothetical protein